MLPVVTRELTVAARRRSTYSIRFISALVAIIAMAWLFVVNAATNPTAQQGKLVFTVLSSLAFAYAILAGALSTSDSVSTEKRDGTLGLLFLTPLKGHQIIFGKFVASSLNVFFGLVTMLPMIGIGIMLGGVSGFQLAIMFAALLNTMFLSLASGIFISTVSRNEREAMFGTIGIMLCLTIAPFVVAIGYASKTGGTGAWNGLEPQFLLASPLFAFISAQGLVIRVSPYNALFQSLAAVHVLGWLLLACASWLLPRVSLEQRKTRANATSTSLGQRLAYGKGESRRRHRQRLLDRNPFAWLAARDRLKPFLVWFFLLALASIGLWFETKMRRDFRTGWLDATALTWILFLVHGFLKIWFTTETCARLSEDRRVGALELLLSAPLSEREIVRGQSLALKRQFLWPILSVLTFDAWLWWSLPGIGTTKEVREAHLIIGAGMLFLVLDLFTIKWVGMWLALVSSKLNWALIGTCTRVMALPWLIFGVWFFAVIVTTWIISNLFSGTTPFGANRDLPFTTTSVLVWTGIGILVDLWFGLGARRKLLREFRLAAADRFHAVGAAVTISVDAPAVASKRTKCTLLKKHPWKFAFGSVILFLALVLAVYRIDLKRKIARELALVRQRGEPISIREPESLALERVTRDPSLRTNTTANILTVLPEILTPNSRSGSMWLSANSAKNRGPLTAELREDYEQAVRLNTNALVMLHAIVPFQKSWIPTDWSHPYGPNFDNYRKLFPTAKLLQIEAILRSDEGNIEEAFRSLNVLFGLGHLLSQEPFVHGKSYRQTFFNHALDTMEFLLSLTTPSESQLRRLEELIARTETSSQNTLWLSDALAGDRVIRIQVFQNPSRVNSGMGGSPPPYLEFVFGALKLLGQADRILLMHLQTIRQLQGVAALPFPENIRAAEQIENSPRPQTRPSGLWQIFTPQPYVGPMLTREANVLARLRAARVALAVERWRLQHQSLPDDLQALVPEFLSAVPNDPFSSQPLHYSPTKNGYEIRANGIGSPGFTVGAADNELLRLVR